MTIMKMIIIGIVIGAGMILPGVSGGVLAVIFGIYEKMLDAITNFFKDWRKNLLFLSPIILGVLIGAIIFSKVLNFVFNKYPMESCFTFIGLIIGGLPTLFNKVKQTEEKKLNLPIYFITFLISIALFVLGRDTINIDISTKLNNGFLSIILLFITGFIYISGKIIPGISSSFMLMLIGMYKYLLGIIANPLSLTKTKGLELVPFLLGIIVGAIVWVKIMNFLLEKYQNKTYSAVLGFVIGSIAAIYPGFSFNYHGLISIILFIISLLFSYWFSKSNINKSE
ncbi:MAG: DUF368 domain-containing protein [Bacilli bacterium]|nr:DUF368 domain-containing protein [Bacilli bacterium]